MTAYFHEVKLKIVGASEVLDIDIAFTESEGVSALLGQTDFFKHYTITFERSKERMEFIRAKK